jgi:hypothetical protein
MFNGKHSLLPHDPRTEWVWPMDSQNFMNNNLPADSWECLAHLSFSPNLGRGISTFVYYWRSISKKNTSDIMRWKTKCAGGCKYRAPNFSLLELSM